MAETSSRLDKMKKIRTYTGGLGNQMFQYAYLLSLVKKGDIPNIYLQDEKYFEDVKDEVWLAFKQGANFVYDKISLHVRRGDYINNPFYVDLTKTDYYERAIELFPNEKFVVFCADRQEGSDDKSDMEWCKEHFKGDRFEFFQGKDEVEDMNAMIGCKGHIMANSSFSWWASYIGRGKTVAPSPEKWYTDGRERTICLKEWIKI